MRPLAVLLLLALALFAAPLAIEAQPAGKIPRIGILTIGSSFAAGTSDNPAPLRLGPAFREGLREHGWVDGKNVRLEWSGRMS